MPSVELSFLCGEVLQPSHEKLRFSWQWICLYDIINNTKLNNCKMLQEYVLIQLVNTFITELVRDLSCPDKET